MKIFSRTKNDLVAHSKAMRLIRFFLIIFVIVLLGGFIMALWEDEHSNNGFSFFDQSLSLLAPDLVNLRITGQDKRDRPYVLTALTVKPKEKEGFVIESGQLSNVEANLELDPEHWLSLRSASGSFNRANHRLSVGPGFNIYASAGYQMHGESADINLSTGEMFVQSRVEGWGPMGEITASALDAKKTGQVMRFYGGVDVVIFPSADKRKNP